jgi:membrane-bound lytic murein transglycosylase C
VWFRPLATCAVVLIAANLTSSCATSKIVGADIKNVVNGQPMDNSGLHQAVSSDAQRMQATLQQLQHKLAEAYAQLKANAQKRWGQNDTKVAERTVYVKYTQGYASRVVTDFDHGTLTVETVDEKSPKESLRKAIVAALLTSSDPTAVDMFTDKDVILEPNTKPYLYGLVHDNNGKSIRTPEQADQFARYLVAHRLQTHPVTSEEDKTAWFVKVAMVSNFEAKGAARYQASVDKYATQYHVRPSLVLAIMRTESNFNPFAVSGAPAYGLMQLVPTSAGREAYRRVQGVDQVPSSDYLLDPEHSIELGTVYLGILSNEEFHAIEKQDSREYCVIAAYNTGPHNVTRTFAADRKEALSDINGMDSAAVYERLKTKLPYEETRQYVVKVTGYRNQLLASAANAGDSNQAPRPVSAP